MPKVLKVLVACEESQAITKEFRKLGHEAFSLISVSHPIFCKKKSYTKKIIMRILKLHHPYGNAYWANGEYRIELPDGTYYKKGKHAYCIPAWARREGKEYADHYSDSHRIIVKPDGIYYQKCSATSGTGKNDCKEPAFLIIPGSEYDKIEYVGIPLTISDELRADLAANGLR